MGERDGVSRLRRGAARCTAAAVSKSFLRDVIARIKKQTVRMGPAWTRPLPLPGGLAVWSKFKFTSSRSWTASHGHEDSYHLDCDALQHIVPFLSGLPKLTTCQIEIGNNVETGAYHLQEEDCYDEDGTSMEYLGLIRSVCRAFRTGELSKDLVFTGLFPYRTEGEGCIWQDVLTKNWLE